MTEENRESAIVKASNDKSSLTSAKKSFSTFPKKFEPKSFEAYFDDVQNSIIERARLKNQDSSKVSLLLIGLDELKKNKHHLDTLREEAKANNKTVNLTKDTTALLKNLQFLYEALIEQDQIHIDTKSLSKITNYLVRMIESILVDKFDFKDSELARFQNALRTKAPDIDAFIISILKSQ